MNEGGRGISGYRALAEALVVIASILIAFALDAWWTKRGELQTERAHLRALHSDFQQNVNRLEVHVGREEQAASASRRLLLVAASPTPLPADSVTRLLNQVFSSTRFAPAMGAYEAIVNSGGLAQIRDDSLRLALAEFASLLEGRYYERFSDELYFDFIRSYTGRLGLSTAVLAMDSSAATDPAVVARSQRELLTDPKFREHLALRYLAEGEVARGYEYLLATAERILDLTGRALGNPVAPRCAGTTTDTTALVDSATLADSTADPHCDTLGLRR